MSTPLERYQKLGLPESLSRIHRYPIACKELSFILRRAYGRFPRKLQSLVFEDTLSAFRLLPQMQTRNAVAAAHQLLQSAEAALPKQKRNLAVSEFKHAKVAHSRRCKTHQEEKGSAQVPQDVLVQIFSFLDLQSLISSGLVCWSWNLAASDNYLWQSQYDMFFGGSDGCLRSKRQESDRLLKDGDYPEDMVNQACIDWKESFKVKYIGNSRKLTSKRGYCRQCNTIVWLNNMKCSNVHSKPKCENQRMKPLSPSQVIEYLLDDSLCMLSSSDSDSESDEESTFRFWAFPRHVNGDRKKPIVGK